MTSSFKALAKPRFSIYDVGIGREDTGFVGQGKSDYNVQGLGASNITV